MKIKIAFTVFWGIFLTVNSYSQKDFLKGQEAIHECIVDTILYSQINLTYSNTTERTFVLWLEKENLSCLSAQEKIRKHFHSREGGDATLMQIILDGNVGAFTPDLFGSFTKIVRPNENFEVVFLKKGKVGHESDYLQELRSRVVIVDAGKVNGLPVEDESLEMFNYPGNTVTVLEEWIF